MTTTPLLLLKIVAFALSGLLSVTAGKLFTRGLKRIAARSCRQRKKD